MKQTEGNIKRHLVSCLVGKHFIHVDFLGCFLLESVTVLQHDEALLDGVDCHQEVDNQADDRTGPGRVGGAPADFEL